MTTEPRRATNCPFLVAKSSATSTNKMADGGEEIWLENCNIGFQQILSKNWRCFFNNNVNDFKQNYKILYNECERFISFQLRDSQLKYSS